jgi:hypothetical protein
LPTRQRQRADVIVMAMRDRNRVHVMRAGLAVTRNRVETLAFRVHPGVEQNAMFVQLDHPRARADVRVWIHIRYIHAVISAQNHEATKQKEFLTRINPNFHKSIPPVFNS